MLPSFRLIAITFCCGFLVVFAGLRLAASVHGVHRAMPVMAAHAAPAPAGAIADRELRRGQSAVPVMYDMRFVVGSAVPASAGAQPVIDRAPSVMMPLVILPPVAIEAERNATPEADAVVVAALAPRPAARPEPPVAIDIPFPEPATVDLSLPPQPKAELPAVAALSPAFAPRTVFDLPIPEPAPVDLTFAPPAPPKEKPAVAAAPPQAEPQVPARAFDIPLPDPAAVDLTLPPAKPEPDIDATGQKRSETDARSQPIEVVALATDVPAGTVKLPTRSIPLPRPKVAVQTAAVQAVQAKSEAKPQAKPQSTQQATQKAKPKPRRKVVRTTQRNDFDSLFGFPSGKPQ
jgi:hypothetical protein